jgi:hypothetical protein
VILDDEPHCNGEGCDVRGGCLRYVALLHKRGTGRVLSYWMPGDPKTLSAVCAGGQERCFERGEELMQDEIVTNARGGSQSNIGVRYDLIPGAFIRGLALLLSGLRGWS